MIRNAGRYIRDGLAVIGLVGTLGGGLVASQAITSLRERMRDDARLPSAFILELDLETQHMVETVPFNLLHYLGQSSQQLEVRRVVRALAHAGGDVRVRGLLAFVGDATASAGLPVVQELRSAVRDFGEKAAGRTPCIAYSDSFGEAGTHPGTASYFLASAFDKVYVQPTGTVNVSGLAVEGVFFKTLLDRWGVRRHLVVRDEFKSAVERLTHDKYSSSLRAATQQLLASMADSVTQGIARSRGIRQAAVQAAMDEAPLSARRAIQLQLVDGARYRDEVVAEAAAGLAADGQPPARVPLSRYLWAMEAEAAAKQSQQGLMPQLCSLWDGGTAVSDSTAPTAPHVAVVHAEGVILESSLGRSPSGAPLLDFRKLCATLRQLRESPAVKAIVLRVNSPGGSAVACDKIHRELSLLTAAGKPVVVSMGNYASSGAYYISVPATRILAQPTTVTGAIGVVAGKLNLAGALRQAGLTTDIVAAGGSNAAAMSRFTDFTKTQRQQVEAATDGVYRHFLRRVAEGRHLSLEAVCTIAKGRTWSGADALQLGLVDQLGGLQDAIEIARREASLSQEAAEAVDYPRPATWLQLLHGVMRGEPLTTAFAAAGLPAGMTASHAVALLLSSMMLTRSISEGSGGTSCWLEAVLAAAAAAGGTAHAAALTAAPAGPQLACDICIR